ncbi:MAG: hypothetical protein HDQ88_07815 [Clostridia bacterium]|nr:hypothetical protein [Clostridia bacterium]
MAICPVCHKECTTAYFDKDYKHIACDQCVVPETKIKACDVCAADERTCYYDKKGHKLGCRSCMHIHLASIRDEFMTK